VFFYDTGNMDGGYQFNDIAQTVGPLRWYSPIGPRIGIRHVSQRETKLPRWEFSIGHDDCKENTSFQLDYTPQ